MQKLKREVKFWIFSSIMRLAINFIPQDAKRTWQWMSEMPLED